MLWNKNTLTKALDFLLKRGKRLGESAHPFV